MSGGSRHQTDHTLRELAAVYAGYIVVGAVWPRIVYFKGRLRGRPLGIHAASVMLWWFAVLQWGRPWARRKQAVSDPARTQLIEELGRAPTEVELMENLGYSTPCVSARRRHP